MLIAINKVKEDKYMLVVISPSKNLNEKDSRLVSPYTLPSFTLEAKRLILILKKLSISEISKLMGISLKLAELNYIRYKNFKTPFTIKNSKQAISLFSGDVYQGFDSKTLSDQDLIYANKHLRILSGLYGLIMPLDIIQPYRLEMGTLLENKNGKDLYAYWGNKLTKSLNNYFKNSDSKVLINLASKEYFKALYFTKIKAQVINIHFKEFRNGQLVFLSFNAKKARGLMSRFIIGNRIAQTEDIKQFNVEGYYFDEQRSTLNDWVFVR